MSSVDPTRSVNRTVAVPVLWFTAEWLGRPCFGVAVPELFDEPGIVEHDQVRAGVGTVRTAQRDVESDGLVPVIRHAHESRLGCSGPQPLQLRDDRFPARDRGATA